MEQVQVRAHAKINLAIDVVGKRTDGYHDLKMIMQSLALHDTLTLTKRQEAGVTIASNSTRMPLDETNIACKAAKFMIDSFSLRQGVHIDVFKRIPIAAGLAGGSSNAAAVLCGINEMFALGLTKGKLTEIGKILGADVPYCICGGTMLAEGIGDILTPLPKHPKTVVVLAKPQRGMSTPKVFGKFSREQAGEKHPDFATILSGLETSDIDKVSRGIMSGMANVLESVTAAERPIINDIKAEFLRNGAKCALMSGSGPTVFAYFADERQANIAAAALRRKFSQLNEIIVTSIE